MHKPSLQVTIHLFRIGKPERTFHEGFVEDDGARLRTFSKVPQDASIRLSEKFHKQGLIPSEQQIASVSKYHFYQEYFSILEFRDQTNELLGYYCDLVTPLQREGGKYFLTDLILDLWIEPDLSILELDGDEFEQAIRKGLISNELQDKILATVERLRFEISQGIFPAHYIQ